jgi:hypothetical protein
MTAARIGKTALAKHDDGTASRVSGIHVDVGTMYDGTVSNPSAGC